MSHTETEIIDDPKRLAALAPEWWQLWTHTPAATLFQSPAWVLPWWDVFHPGRLASICVRIDGRLAGLAPLWLEHGPHGVRLLPAGIGLSDYCDILLDPDCGHEAAQLLGAAIGAIPDWEICEFSELMQGASAFAVAMGGCECELRDASAAPVLPLGTGTNDLFDVIPAVQRRNVRRARAAAEKHGAVEVAAAGAGNAKEFLRDLIDLHTARWRESGQEGVFADHRVGEFHSRLVPEMAARNLLRMFRIRIAGRVAAVYYGFFDHHRAQAYLQGYDPAFSDCSPGVLIVAHAIGHAIRDRAIEFHFLRGDEPYKFAWGAVRQVNRTRILKRASNG